MLFTNSASASTMVTFTTLMMETGSFADDYVTASSNRSFPSLSENTTQDLLPVSASTDVVIVVWLVFATVVAVAGNAAIVWIVVATPTLRSTPHNRLVVQLAICDLLTAVLNAPPIAATMTLGRWTLGDASCQLHGASTTLFGVASVITLAVISLNRSASSFEHLNLRVRARQDGVSCENLDML